MGEARRRRRVRQKGQDWSTIGMLHDNKNIRIVLDLSGQQPSEQMQFEGVMREDAKVSRLGGAPAVHLVVQCGEIHVVGAIVEPTDLALSLLPRLRKQTRVRISGYFQPTTFERHGDTDLTKPIGGFMVVASLAILP